MVATFPSYAIPATTRAPASSRGKDDAESIIELGRRTARGFRNFEHYRLRMLLITGGLDTSPHTQT